MTTTKTTISRHFNVTDLLIYIDEGEPQHPVDERDLWRLISKTDAAQHEIIPTIIRCADTHDIVDLEFHQGGLTRADAYRDCGREHWRLVHCTIETGQEIS